MPLSRTSPLCLALFLGLATLLVSPPGAARKLPTNKLPTKAQELAKPRAAVLYFDYRGQDPELGFLRKGLAQMLVSDLSDQPSLTIVERNDLENVLKEIKLSRTKFIDRRTANRIGKLLGARYLITGGYFVWKDTLHVNAKVIDVETGVVKGVSLRGPMDDFLDLESDLAQRLEAKLLAAHSAAKPAAKGGATKQGTTKKAAKASVKKKVAARTVARYGRALDSIDKGDTKVAMKELEELKQAAPEFQLARDELKSLLR